MEGLTRLVSESLARHGFDRPLDYRRLHWSRWFRCESHHSLLFVPSKPGVFALAEEILSHGGADALVRPASRSEAPSTDAHVETAASAVPPVPALSLSKGRSAAEPSHQSIFAATTNREGHDFSRAAKAHNEKSASAAEGPRRMLAVTQFFEDDDMAFVLDRMLSRQNPMRARLISGRYFVRFVVIEDQSQRRSICNALNQWMASSVEKATGIGADFASSLELTPATEYTSAANDAQQSLFAVATDTHVGADASCPELTRRVRPAERSEAAPGIIPGPPASDSSPTTPQLDSGAATNIHCPSPFPSGF